MPIPTISPGKYLNAARTGDVGTVQKYIAESYNIGANYKDVDVSTFISELVKNNDREYQSHYNKVNVCDSEGNNALIFAARNGWTEIVKFLLTTCIDVNAVANESRSNALLCAVMNGEKHCLDLLLTSPRLDVNSTNKNGETALIIASSWGDFKLVNRLLSVPRINVNAKDKRGYTALMYAAESGHPDTTRLLLANGADANLENNHGMTAEMLASDKKIKADSQTNDDEDNDADYSVILYILASHRAATSNKKLEEFLDKRKFIEEIHLVLNTPFSKLCLENLAKLSIKLIVSNIRFLQEHLRDQDDFPDLSTLVKDFSNFLVKAGNCETLGTHSRVLLTSAAKRADRVIKAILENSEDVVITDETSDPTQMVIIQPNPSVYANDNDATTAHRLNEYISIRNRDYFTCDKGARQNIIDLCINSIENEIEYLSTRVHRLDKHDLSALLLIYTEFFLTLDNSDEFSRALFKAAASLGNAKADNVVSNFHKKRHPYPAQLTLFGVREAKVTAPQVVNALHKMEADARTRPMASIVACKFLSWAKQHNRQFNAHSIKEVRRIAR